MPRKRVPDWPSTRRLGWRLVLCAVGLVVPVLPAVGAASAWRTGPALRQAFQTRLTQIQWEEAPLRQVVETLGREQRVAVLLDRRVDPGQLVDLSLSGLTLGEVFWQIAQSRNLESVPLGPVVYFGPAPEVSKLETALEVARRAVQQLPAGVRRRWQEPRALLWKRLTVPSELLVRLASDSQIELVGIEQVPYDLWDAADLPALALVDRLGLIAGQFGLMLELAPEGNRASLVPIPDDVSVVESYPGGRDPKELVRRWSALAPTSQIRVVDGKIEVRGSVREQQRIGASLRPDQPKTGVPASSATGTARYTVPQSHGTLERLLEEYCQRLELTLKLDREEFSRAGISLEQPVSFSVRDATREGLFRAMLDPVGCTFRIEGKTLTVRPKGKSR